MSHPAHPGPLTFRELATLLLILSPIAAITIWGVVRARRGRAAVRAALSQDGLQIIRMRSHRFAWRSPFGIAHRGELIYRFCVRDLQGRERRGWACWGRKWILDSDTLQLRWDD